MKYIADFVLDINEELCGAKEYAEKYVYNKSHGNIPRAKIYYEQAQDEIRHAKNIHDIAVEEINKLNEVYTATSEMKEMWEKAHNEYVDRMAWVKQMLTM